MKNKYGIGKFLICIGVIILIFIIVNVFRTKKENQVMPWDTGKITIVNKDIQLPCSLEEFKNIFGIEISKTDDGYGFYDIEIPYYHTTLKFSIHIKNNYITYISLPIYDSDETESDAYKFDKQTGSLTANEQWVAQSVIFPGGLTARSSTEEILNLYGKSNDKKTKEYDDKISHMFIGKDYVIEFKITENDEISDIIYQKK